MAQLHLLLSRSPTPAMGILDLFAAYKARFLDDPCSVRDAMIVMDQAPHLFIPISADFWAALGPGGVDDADADLPAAPLVPIGISALSEVPNLSDNPLDHSVGEDDPLEDGSDFVGTALSDALGAIGPSRFTDLVDAAASVLPADRSVNSFSPVLLSRRDVFVRLLPGVYALHHQVLTPAEIMTAELPYFLNEGQARHYALARWAGDPWGTFPLWCPASEWRLCEWARTAAPRAVFRSLLAVAEVDAWPIADEARSRWRLVKQRFGLFALAARLRRESAYARPPLERVLAACLYVEAHGNLNWLAANRVLGILPTAHVGAGLLAVMVLLDAVSVPDQGGEKAWLRSHPASAGLGSLRLLLEREIVETGGRLSWYASLGAELLARMRAAPARSMGWIDAEGVSWLVEGRACDLVGSAPISAHLIP